MLSIYNQITYAPLIALYLVAIFISHTSTWLMQMCNLVYNKYSNYHEEGTITLMSDYYGTPTTLSCFAILKLLM